jgi:hypothetical protein
VPAFTPLRISDFGEGWLTPWIPPPNGELHLQRGGWVGADSAFSAESLTSHLLSTRERQERVMNLSGGYFVRSTEPPPPTGLDRPISG